METAEREFSQLKTEIQKLSNNGPILLTGDFNAKLKIDRGTKKQARSRNGKLLEEMLSITILTPVSKESETGKWTRVNRKKTSKRSLIDYIMIKKSERAKNLKRERKSLRKKAAKAIKNADSPQKGTPTSLLEHTDDHPPKDGRSRERANLNNNEKNNKRRRHKIKNLLEVKRKAKGQTNDSDYPTITENGDINESNENAKEHIIEFFENLYQAREGRPEYTNWMEEIKQTTKRPAESTEMNKRTQDIPVKEITEAIKKLKREKAMAPDEISNQIFIKANTDTLEKYHKILNNIAKTKLIPPQWQTGKIVRLYKGKGKKGKCSNERGITLASNVGKVFERIINERVRTKVNMSENQPGGKKNNTITDHILILQTTIKEIRKKKKPVYMVFLDVTKVYDNAWLNAIMYVMHKEGLNTPEWNIVKKLNENLKAKIQTKYGETTAINIKDSIG